MQGNPDSWSFLRTRGGANRSVGTGKSEPVVDDNHASTSGNDISPGRAPPLLPGTKYILIDLITTNPIRFAFFADTEKGDDLPNRRVA